MKLEDLSLDDLKRLHNPMASLCGEDRRRLREAGEGQWSQVFHKPLPLGDDGNLPADEGHHREYVRLDFDDLAAG